MAEYNFKKGHKNVYLCKPIDINLFREAFYAYFTFDEHGKRLMSQQKAAKHAQVSVPTFMKYCKMIICGEPLPEGIWKNENENI